MKKTGAVTDDYFDFWLLFKMSENGENACCCCCPDFTKKTNKTSEYTPFERQELKNFQDLFLRKIKQISTICASVNSQGAGTQGHLCSLHICLHDGK